MVYAIAQYLPLKARQLAAARVYPRLLHQRPCPRTADGYCPLGVAIAAMGIRRAPGRRGRWLAPHPITVAEALSRHWDERHAIQDAAASFIDDWDSGAIMDLPAALGVASP